MIDDQPDQEFDRFLRDSLKSRPLPRSSSILATRARARAVELGSGGVLEKLARRWRWGLRVNMLAGAVLVAIFAAFVPILLQRAATNIQSYNGQSDSITADSAIAESASSQLTDSLFFGGAILLGAILLVAVQHSLEDENRSEIHFISAIHPSGPRG